MSSLSVQLYYLGLYHRDSFLIVSPALLKRSLLKPEPLHQAFKASDITGPNKEANANDSDARDYFKLQLCPVDSSAPESEMSVNCGVAPQGGSAAPLWAPRGPERIRCSSLGSQGPH